MTNGDPMKKSLKGFVFLWVAQLVYWIPVYLINITYYSNWNGYPSSSDSFQPSMISPFFNLYAIISSNAFPVVSPVTSSLEVLWFYISRLFLFIPLSFVIALAWGFMSYRRTAGKISFTNWIRAFKNQEKWVFGSHLWDSLDSPIIPNPSNKNDRSAFYQRIRTLPTLLLCIVALLIGPTYTTLIHRDILGTVWVAMIFACIIGLLIIREKFPENIFIKDYRVPDQSWHQFVIIIIVVDGVGYLSDLNGILLLNPWNWISYLQSPSFLGPLMLGVFAIGSGLWMCFDVLRARWIGAAYLIVVFLIVGSTRPHVLMGVPLILAILVLSMKKVAFPSWGVYLGYLGASLIWPFLLI